MNALRKFTQWYFSRKALPYWCILLIDCALVYMSGLIVLYIQYGGLSLVQSFWPMSLGLLLCLGAYMVSFFAFHTFKGVMRYSSFVDLHRVVYSTLAATIGVCLLHQVQVHAVVQVVAHVRHRVEVNHVMLAVAYHFQNLIAES